MVLDEELLQQARDAAGRLADAQHQAEIAKADYQHAVRHLHVAGGSMREIAQALGISHQRVHQVVEEAGGRRRLDAKSSADLACSFCGRGKNEVDRIVAGPRVCICNDCAAGTRRAVAQSGPAAAAHATFDLVTRRGARCSFCARRARKSSVLVGAVDADACICADCLDLLDEILLEASDN